MHYFQDHLLQLELEGNVRVNYTGSWLKTVNWLQWLTLLAARKYNGGKCLLAKRNLLNWSYFTVYASAITVWVGKLEM